MNIMQRLYDLIASDRDLQLTLICVLGLMLGAVLGSL